VLKEFRGPQVVQDRLEILELLGRLVSKDQLEVQDQLEMTERQEYRESLARLQHKVRRVQQDRKDPLVLRDLRVRDLRELQAQQDPMDRLAQRAHKAQLVLVLLEPQDHQVSKDQLGQLDLLAELGMSGLQEQDQRGLQALAVIKGLRELQVRKALLEQDLLAQLDQLEPRGLAEQDQLVLPVL
jgi:hypothetical protein